MLLFSFLLAVVVSLASTKDTDVPHVGKYVIKNYLNKDSPHVHIKNKWLLTSWPDNTIETSVPNVEGADTSELIVSKYTLSGQTDKVTVTWKNVSYMMENDYIGLFNATPDTSLFTGPPIKFKYICEYLKCDIPPSNGELEFDILNRRTEYQFAYISQFDPYREFRAVSDKITFENLYQPMHLHLALISSDTASFDNALRMAKPQRTSQQSEFIIQVMWVQKTTDKPTVRFGLTKKLGSSVVATNITTYDPSMMCDTDQGMPAGLGGYFEPGYFLNAYIADLQPSTQYFYQVGDNKYGWSDVWNFTTPPLRGNYQPRDDKIKFTAFADLGQIAIDWSMHHSWDFDNHGELYSINTTHTIARSYINGDLEVSDFLLHTGDISYAVGFLSEWDDFNYQIEPMARALPYMMGIGNHEYSWSGEWKPPNLVDNPFGTADGGGECGVPYNSYYPYASVNPWSSPIPTERKPWYYFDYGVIRTIVMSTEHDFSIDSEQWKWMESAMKGMDRSVLPWLIVTGHRPMYTNAAWEGDISTHYYMVEQLESLFLDYKVSIGLWGHSHQYDRSYPVINDTVQAVGEGPVHIVMGMAGYQLNEGTPEPPHEQYVFSTNKYYGFMHFTIGNATHAYGKFINAADGTILEDFHIVNFYH